MKKTNFFYDGDDYNAYMNIPLFQLKYFDYVDEFRITTTYAKNNENLFKNKTVFNSLNRIERIYFHMCDMIENVLDVFYSSDDYNCDIPIFPQLEITLLITEQTLNDGFKRIANIELNFYK